MNIIHSYLNLLQYKEQRLQRVNFDKLVNVLKKKLDKRVNEIDTISNKEI